MAAYILFSRLRHFFRASFLCLLQCDFGFMLSLFHRTFKLAALEVEVRELHCLASQAFLVRIHSTCVPCPEK